MGGLVQPPPAARAHRKRTAGRSRSALLRSEGGACPSRVIQAKTPPRNPERFNQTNLAPAANHVGIVAALYVSNRVSESRWQPTLLSLAGNQRKVAAARGRVG